MSAPGTVPLKTNTGDLHGRFADRNDPAGRLRLLELADVSREALRQQIEHDVRFANIAIIEGNQASQFGIGIVAARIAKAVLRDERVVVPIGSYNDKYGVTLSMPSVLGRTGVVKILEPSMSDDERGALSHSAETLKKAVAAFS